MAAKAPNRIAQLRIERLYWRAGFGAMPAELTYLTRLGLPNVIKGLLAPKGAQLRNAPGPTVDGVPIDPKNEYGHDVLWWLDRAVRGRHPLVERMTLNWHDHFATSNQKVGDSQLMINQYFLIRKRALGSFRGLAQAILKDRAMQQFLDLSNSDKDDPNENFARELFELFTLGVNNGYTEQDIREAARALTGFTFDYDTKVFSYDPEHHDDGVKRIFGKTGRFTPADVVNLAVSHPKHPGYICKKIWGYFTEQPCPKSTLRRMMLAYNRSKTQIKPVLQIILTSPQLYANLGEPDQVKPPLVYVAGMLRKTGMPVNRMDWRWLLDDMGQVPFNPPNVNGWEQNEAWMSTASIRARYSAASTVIDMMKIEDGSIDKKQTPGEAIAMALKATGRPWYSTQTKGAMQYFARTSVEGKTDDWEVEHFWPERQRVLRHLLLAGPDAQVC